jgi:SAM-dependent methyltransferase
MAFETLKQRQSEMWGAAPFEAIADTVVPIYEDLIEHLGVNEGESWLDLATGTGGVALRVARRGAVVTGQDLAPALIETAQRLAAAEGLRITFEQGDCENLPYADASFDVVSSSLGVVFAPDHAAVARELSRVCRAGGRLGFTSWRPGGAIHEFLRLQASYLPPAPEGAGSTMSWGRRDYVETMLGGAFTLDFFDGDAPLVGESPEALYELFAASFGPFATITASLDADRQREFRDAFLAYFEQYRTDRGVSAPREYLVVIGTRRES